MNVMRYVKIGIFFITLGTAGSIYVIKSSDGFSSFNTRDYEVVMDDATGLSTNSKVYLAGVPVGKIREIDLSEGRALLTVAFLRDVEIRSDARLSRRSSSILGTSILALDPGSDEMPAIRSGGRISVMPGAADISAVTASVQQLSAQMTELIGVSLERVTRILEASAQITERLERILAEREEDLGSSAVELRLALENIRAITDEIRQGQGNIGRAVNGDELYEGLLSTVERTEDAAGKLEETLDSVNALATDARALAKNADVLVSKASRLGVQVDAQARYDMIYSGLRSNASIRLEPGSGDRWYRVGVGSAPDGLLSTTSTETAVDGSPTVRTVTEETSSGFTVDAELAREIGAFTLRGGLLENTAGLGLDYRIAEWVTLSGEVFDFRKDAQPNLRGTVTVYPFFDPYSLKPWNWLYVRGGVTSALDERRDFFVSAGVRFADEEVRGLVGLVPLGGN